ncbi:M24 family metallopeptidase [Corynebacterium ureicelerivorans]|uniref:Peptidase M24 n=1 Tax=Corynebacterium ureicelerivorans TaxID=401472 RepID=A0A077HKS1_9CORY|nr:Xaa-Pro peptidase family protein [Corynebacterium ureicelerivorans]AIL96915.1 peptidase M24 [Corynebacterium ureicelerivorans]
MTAFDPDVYSGRRNRAARLLQDRGLGGLVIGTGAEFAFLTGSWASSHERLTALVIAPDGAAVVAPVTDIQSLGLEGAADVEVLGWRDGDNPYQLVAERLGEGTIGVGSSLTADHVFALQGLLPRTELASDAVAELFMVKDAEEIAQLERAGAAIDRVHERAAELLRPGRTERDVAEELHQLILDEHDTVEFVIVGSGPNGSNPHHDFSDRVLEPGDPVVVDLGGALPSGYQSDCTRTHVVGEPAQAPKEFLQAYEVLQQAFQAACNAARPGMTAGDLDAVARNVIEQGGYGEYFTHRLGHGIGLSGHEQPFIIAGSDVELREGMVFSIEPGIYKPGEWGMRIEDIVRMTADGVVTLNHTRRALGGGDA